MAPNGHITLGEGAGHRGQEAPSVLFGRVFALGGDMCTRGLTLVVVASISVACLANCGGSPTPTLTSIAVQPHSILSWPDQLFTVVGLYSDHSTRPLEAQVNWTNDAWWVRIDVVAGSSTAQANAVCLAPAPVNGLVLPQPSPATITATATVHGQTFSSSGTLYCH